MLAISSILFAFLLILNGYECSMFKNNDNIIHRNSESITFKQTQTPQGSNNNLVRQQLGNTQAKPNTILNQQPTSLVPPPKLEKIPLYPGYGTHFAYIYVGKPPKRVSVILDTASEATAFPCLGCMNCGKHTDPLFNPLNSSTSIIPSCSKYIFMNPSSSWYF